MLRPGTYDLFGWSDMNTRIKGLLIGCFGAIFFGFLTIYYGISGRLYVWFGESTTAKYISNGTSFFFSLAAITSFLTGIWQFISGKDYLPDDKPKENKDIGAEIDAEIETDELYREAYCLYEARNFEKARAVSNEILKNYPTSKQAKWVLEKFNFIEINEPKGQSERMENIENINFSKRVLCPDGNCIGVIGNDGSCSECGKKY